MPKFDHHVHTSKHSPDSVIEPKTLLKRAKAVGLDGVVITDHDYQWKAGELAELAAKGKALGVKVFSGVEVSAREGHFLVYGLPDLNDVSAGIALRDLLRVVRSHKAAIVAAHPFRWDQDFDRIVEEHDAPFDAVELVSNNVTRETRAKTEALIARRPFAATGSSDGHEPANVGCYYTEFPDHVTIETIGDFVAAIRGKTGKPGHSKGSPEACGPVD